MKKQTAVQWLVSILNKQGFAPVLTDEEIQQANAMEKDQTIEFAKWMHDFNADINKVEQYYNETFNK